MTKDIHVFITANFLSKWDWNKPNIATKQEGTHARIFKGEFNLSLTV